MSLAPGLGAYLSSRRMTGRACACRRFLRQQKTPMMAATSTRAAAPPAAAATKAVFELEEPPVAGAGVPVPVLDAPGLVAVGLPFTPVETPPVAAPPVWPPVFAASEPPGVHALIVPSPSLRIVSMPPPHGEYGSTHSYVA
jgi:hypothetical protein